MSSQTESVVPSDFHLGSIHNHPYVDPDALEELMLREAMRRSVLDLDDSFDLDATHDTASDDRVVFEAGLRHGTIAPLAS